MVRSGDRVADLGTGSAVLAIAAAKLGASRVAAIELDHDAIGNAEENVKRNGVSDRVTIIEGDASLLLPLVAPLRVITANIISSVLSQMLPAIAAALSPDGQAILSGIRRMKSDSYTSVVPCVAVVGPAHEEFERAFEAGADEVIRESDAPEEAVTRLDAMLRRKRVGVQSAQ